MLPTAGRNQCVNPIWVAIHRDSSGSTRSERMKSSGRPSAEVNVVIVPPRIRLRPSGVPTHRSPLGAEASERITSLGRPFRTEYVEALKDPPAPGSKAVNPLPLVPTHRTPP